MMNLTIRTLGLCLGVALGSNSAGQSVAAERVPVTSIKPLLIAAIDSGEAHGTLVGDSAKFMQERFKSTATIEIDVKTLTSLGEAGCKRLEVITRQEGVTDLAGQPPTQKALVYQVSYCRDGRFPTAK